MIKLRDYQEEVLTSLRKSISNRNKRIIMQLATGGGKTIIFTYIAKQHIEKGGKVLVITHRKELLKQSGSVFEDFGLTPDFITAGKSVDWSKSLHVAMIETLNKRKDDYMFDIVDKTLVIIDEAHINNFTKIFPFISYKAFVIGATATPYRKGQDVPALKDFYTDITQGITTTELIKKGYLSKCNTYGIKIDLADAKHSGDDYNTEDIYKKNKTYKGVIENYERLSKNKKTLIFASSVKSSKDLAEKFNQKNYECKHIDGKTPPGERDNILEWFENTDNAILCNCGILTAGYDCPEIETIILYRATTSLPLFLQMVGRGSRTTDTKKEFILLDFGNNIRRLGFWQSDRAWTLEKDDKPKTKKDAFAVKDCKNCGAILAVTTKKCPYCGATIPKSKKEINDEEIAVLELMTYTQRNDADLVTKAKLCKAKMMKASVVLHSLNDIVDAREFIQLMGYKSGFEFTNKDRYEVFGS